MSIIDVDGKVGVVVSGVEHQEAIRKHDLQGMLHIRLVALSEEPESDHCATLENYSGLRQVAGKLAHKPSHKPSHWQKAVSAVCRPSCMPPAGLVKHKSLAF